MIKINGFFLLIIYILSTTLCFTQVNAQYMKNKKKIFIIKTKLYKSHCLNCDSCKTLIENSILELKGIQTIDIDFIKKTIIVVFNGKFTEEKHILSKVNKAGYCANNTKANALQRKQLLHTCKQ